MGIDETVAGRLGGRAAGQDRYRQHRPMVERTIVWLVRRGYRRVRYRGIAANLLRLTHRAAAVNVQRVLVLGLTHQHGA